MGIKLTLDSNIILQKVFPSSLRGYDPLEVDRFLDDVLRDYHLIETSVLLSNEEHDKLNSKIVLLEKEKQELEVELAKYKARFHNIKDNDVVSSENIDLVKRINALEKFLYNHGYHPNQIK